MMPQGGWPRRVAPFKPSFGLSGQFLTASLRPARKLGYDVRGRLQSYSAGTAYSFSAGTLGEG
jgi:hypothetical protein